MVPVGFTAAGGALVACTAAVGTAVGAFDGADEVGCAGTAVGEVVPLDDGVAVAEDPQANNRATNSNTIAFGRCLEISGRIAEVGTSLSPCVTNYL